MFITRSKRGREFRDVLKNTLRSIAFKAISIRWVKEISTTFLLATWPWENTERSTGNRHFTSKTAVSAMAESSSQAARFGGWTGIFRMDKVRRSRTSSFENFNRFNDSKHPPRCRLCLRGLFDLWSMIQRLLNKSSTSEAVKLKTPGLAEAAG